MALLMYSVVRRHMKTAGSFTLHDGVHHPPVTLPLEADESLMGWYHNPAPWGGSFLIFTSRAIGVLDERRTLRVPLRDIVGYDSPETKSDVSGLVVRTRDGSCFMRAAGSHGPSDKFKDFIALMMVLRAVLGSKDVL